jgi:hypothetical protein
MKIVGCKVRMNDGWGNSPDIDILVDEIDASWKKFRCKSVQKDDGCILFGLHTEVPGLTIFRSVPPEGTTGFNAGGLGGTYGMEDGTEKYFGGCWSSNSPAINELNIGPQCTEVTLYDNSRTGWGGIAMTIEALKPLIDALDPIPEAIIPGTQFKGGETRPGGKPVLMKITGSVWGGPRYEIGLRQPDGSVWMKSSHMHEGGVIEEV